MECRDALTMRELAVRRLSRELTPEEDRILLAHIGRCEACRNEARTLESVWERLEEDPDEAPDERFLDLAKEKVLQAVRRSDAGAFTFRSRPAFPAVLLRAAVVLLAAGAGFVLARATAGGTAVSGGRASAAAPSGRFALVSRREVDASCWVPDLTEKPHLSNVAFRPADASGRIGVSFEMTTRYTVDGRPSDPGMGDLLAYLMSRDAETEGARGKAIELVSEQSRGGTPVSPQIVSVLVETLTKDRNPGVRRKAAETLTQLPPSEAIRDALIRALRTDDNPAVRITAVEGLAKAATVLKDAATIDTLRETARDEKETGYVRGRAALALKKIDI